MFPSFCKTYASSPIAVRLLLALLLPSLLLLSTRLEAFQVWDENTGQVVSQHPLSALAEPIQDERISPPVHNAPHRTLTPQPQSFTEQSVLDPTLDLVLPPHPQNSLNPNGVDASLMSREAFWRQFATTPPEDKKGRTEGYGSLQATLNNGFWFGAVEFMYLEPMFQANNAFTTTLGNLSTAQQVDFGFDVSYRVNFGFETNAGPALKFSFWSLNNFSAIHDVSITGGRTAVTTIDLGDASSQFRLGEFANNGSRLTVQQQMKFDSSEFVFYKDQVNPVSRIRGNVAIRHVQLLQKLFAGLDDPIAGAQIVRNTNDYLGVGPKLGIEYFRPIGHTDLELQSGMSGSILFGRREQVFNLSGPSALRFRQAGKVETLSIFEMYIGVQWNWQVSRCRRLFLRTALESQFWAGSDSALNVGDDFGLYGMSFAFGMTR